MHKFPPFHFFDLDFLHQLQFEAACILSVTLHIIELKLDTFSLVLGISFVIKQFLSNELFYLCNYLYLKSDFLDNEYTKTLIELNC
jgi:hypothetical protein